MQSQAESDHLNRNLAANFKAREFVCPCCYAEGIKDQIVYHLQIAHGQLPPNSVMILTSAYRCEKYIADKGYSPTTSHGKGLAVDIKCDNAPFRFDLIQALLNAGFTRIGLGKDFIHADLDEDKDQDVIWTYY